LAAKSWYSLLSFLPDAVRFMMRISPARAMSAIAFLVARIESPASTAMVSADG